MGISVMRHELPAIELRTVLAIASVAIVLSSCRLFGFIDDRVREGEAYGLLIGETVEQTFDRAMAMQHSGEIHQIEIGSGSGAVLYDAKLHSPIPGDKFQLVVDPTVWNDTIYLTFENGSLVEIWRFRSPTELP
jgi:uncharacterized protein (UPF0548 family)